MSVELGAASFEGIFLSWDKGYPRGCPRHCLVPFAFKPYCFYEAWDRGLDLVLWVDASIRIRSPIGEIFESIVRDGYFIIQESHSVGEYCKDEALSSLGITREESFVLPSCWGGVLGLDLRNPQAREFLNQWFRLATDGVTFPGPKYSGQRGWPLLASVDPRVKGHRFDQTAASVLALRLAMTKWHNKADFKHVIENDRGSVALVGSPDVAELQALHALTEPTVRTYTCSTSYD